MKFILKIVVFLVYFNCFIGISQTGTSSIKWIEDINFLANELTSNHINLFFKKDSVSFFNDINHLKSSITNYNYTDLEIAIKVQQIIAEQGDSHTFLQLQPLLNKEENLPLKVLWFKDGLYIISTNFENESILGKKIIGINEIDIQTIVNQIATVFTNDNEATKMKNIPFLLVSTQLLKNFGIIRSNQVVLQLETANGLIENYTIKKNSINKLNEVKVELGNVPLYLLDEKKYFWYKTVESDSLLFIQYNKCSSREVEEKFGNKKKAITLPSFQKFEEEVFQVLEKPFIDKVVFDMRFNTGGNSLQGDQFILRLAENKKINKQGKLFVVIGKHTFSSAILNTLTFKEKTEAIIVGEPTSGKPNHYGELKSFELPNSKLKVYYSTKYFKRIDEDVNSIYPDFEIQTTFNDFIRGIDPVYEWIKNKK